MYSLQWEGIGYCHDTFHPKNTTPVKSTELGVFNFKDLQGYPDIQLGIMVADMLSETLHKSRKVKVRNRNKLRIDMKKNKLHFPVPPSPQESIGIARKLGLKYVVTGYIVNFEDVFKENRKWFGSKNVDFYISIQYSLWEAETGKNILSDRIDDFVKQRVAEMPNLGDRKNNKKFLESIFFLTVAKIAIRINDVL